MNILVTLNKNYLPYLISMLKSLVDNNNDYFDIYIFSNDINYKDIDIYHISNKLKYSLYVLSGNSLASICVHLPKFVIKYLCFFTLL